LWLGQGCGQQQWKEGTGGDQRRPLHGEHTGPIGISEKDEQPGVAMPRETEGQQGRTDSPEESGGHFRPQAHEGKCEHCRRERVLFERRIVGVLPGQQPVRKT